MKTEEEIYAEPSNLKVTNLKSGEEIVLTNWEAELLFSSLRDKLSNFMMRAMHDGPERSYYLRWAADIELLLSKLSKLDL